MSDRLAINRRNFMQRAGLLGGIAAGIAADNDNAKSRGSSATGLSIINMTSILKLDRSNQRQLHEIWDQAHVLVSHSV